MYLCDNIVSGKIPIDISHAEKGMRHIIDKSTSEADVKLLLVEDWHLHFYFQEALAIIIEQNGRPRKKTNINRCRKV